MTAATVKLALNLSQSILSCCLAFCPSSAARPIAKVAADGSTRGAGAVECVDGVVASTYIAHVPLGVWKVFADGYAALRYKMGAPIAPEGEGYFSITWPLAVYDKLGVPTETVVSTLWPITTAAAALTELANTLMTPVAAALLLAAALARKAAAKAAIA